jgi:shikimate kinase
MSHLQNISNIIYLDAEIDVIRSRIYNFETRGIAKSKTQTFQDLFVERRALYRKYAEFTVDCNSLNQEEIAEFIFTKLINQF